jgi:hypothetical protein
MKIKLLCMDGPYCEVNIWLKKWKWIREKFKFKAENNKWMSEQNGKTWTKRLDKRTPYQHDYTLVDSHGHPYTYH